LVVGEEVEMVAVGFGGGDLVEGELDASAVFGDEDGEVYVWLST
jgi:hypothetical protein